MSIARSRGLLDCWAPDSAASGRFDGVLELIEACAVLDDTDAVGRPEEKMERRGGSNVVKGVPVSEGL